uniref:Large ribosomal subunit protein uL23c n=2 Tax=Ophioglossum TaxID=13833 RepID=L7T1P7_9MONI|nr:ribosomal protein L23 [Ophioglossum californicum]AGC26754.1 ribosomal protein L23 [Ophioglossum californicum]QXF60127.1 ribosomal protein L23 [Ophioglossum vulgatum]
MDRIKNQVLTEKTIKLLRNNQYTFNVDLGSTKTEAKNLIEGFFNVKVGSINSYRVSRNKRSRRLSEKTSNQKRMIVTLRTGYSIPLFPDE